MHPLQEGLHLNQLSSPESHDFQDNQITYILLSHLVYPGGSAMHPLQDGLHFNYTILSSPDNPVCQVSQFIFTTGGATYTLSRWAKT